MPIEISFGILVSRFRILSRMLAHKLGTSIDIVKCLVCLHNFLMAKECPEDVFQKFYSKKHLGDQDADENYESEESDEDEQEEEAIPTLILQNKHKIRDALASFFLHSETK